MHRSRQPGRVDGFGTDSSAASGTNCATGGVLLAKVRDDEFMASHEPSGDFWFCMEHHRVETGENTHSSDHLGPFPTEDAAARALETVAEREKAYDAEDAAWNGQA